MQTKRGVLSVAFEANIEGAWPCWWELQEMAGVGVESYSFLRGYCESISDFFCETLFYKHLQKNKLVKN